MRRRVDTSINESIPLLTLKLLLLLNVKRPRCTFLEPSSVRQDCYSFLDLFDFVTVEKNLGSPLNPVSIFGDEVLTSFC